MVRILVTLLLLIASSSWAANICDPVTGTNCASVEANKGLGITEAKSSKATYIASSSALATTAAYNLSIEAGASQGFRLSGFCVSISNATAAAAVTVSVNRRTTASAAGTQLTNEGTGADSISKMDPADASFPGIARRTATLGTIGATLFQTGFMVGELGAGAADPPSEKPFCYYFGHHGGKLPVIQAGTTNGVSITVTAPGAGGLASGAISAELIAD